MYLSSTATMTWKTRIETQMANSHNKKRNTGLLYEFLVQTISKALVEGDQKRSRDALRVLRRHFKPGTELYKEYRLVNSLVRTTVSSEAVAASIVHEAKLAARSYDSASLDREKSLLISTINKAINDDNFYDRPVNEYRVYATVQTLLNDWRSPDRDLGRVGLYEDQLVKWLVTEKQSSSETLVSEGAPGESRLLMKVMMKRLNEKYASSLTSEQKQLVKAYAFSTANDDPTSLQKKLVEVKERLVSDIDAFSANNPDNDYVNAKLAETRQQLEGEELDTVDDATVTRFMLYTKLSTELTSEEP